MCYAVDFNKFEYLTARAYTNGYGKLFVKLRLDDMQDQGHPAENGGAAGENAPPVRY